MKKPNDGLARETLLPEAKAGPSFPLRSCAAATRRRPSGSRDLVRGLASVDLGRLNMGWNL